MAGLLHRSRLRVALVNCKRKINRTRATHNKMELLKLETGDKTSNVFNLIVLDFETIKRLRRDHKNIIVKQLKALDDEIERSKWVYSAYYVVALFSPFDHL